MGEEIKVKKEENQPKKIQRTLPGEKERGKGKTPDRVMKLNR